MSGVKSGDVDICDQTGDGRQVIVRNQIATNQVKRIVFVNRSYPNAVKKQA